MKRRDFLTTAAALPLVAATIPAGEQSVAGNKLSPMPYGLPPDDAQLIDLPAFATLERDQRVLICYTNEDGRLAGRCLSADSFRVDMRQEQKVFRWLKDGQYWYDVPMPGPATVSVTFKDVKADINDFILFRTRFETPTDFIVMSADEPTAGDIVFEMVSVTAVPAAGFSALWKEPFKHLTELQLVCKAVNYYPDFNGSSCPFPRWPGMIKPIEQGTIQRSSVMNIDADRLEFCGSAPIWELDR